MQYNWKKKINYITEALQTIKNQGQKKNSWKIQIWEFFWAKYVDE